MLTQEAQQGQQGEAKDRGVLPLDALEQLCPQTFQPVGTDARRQGVAFRSEIVLEEPIGKRAHDEAWAGEMLKDALLAALADHARHQDVRLAAQGAQLLARGVRRFRLVVPSSLADQDLVGADHQRASRAPRHPLRLQGGEHDGCVIGAATLGLYGALRLGLVDRGGLSREGKPGGRKHRATRGGLACQNKTRDAGLEHAREDNRMSGTTKRERDRQVIAVFETLERARGAREQLLKEGIPRREIDIVHQHGEDAHANFAYERTAEGFWDALRNLFIPGEHAAGYAEGLARGHAVLAVRPASTEEHDRVEAILESFEPIDFDAQEEAWRKAGWTGSGRQTLPVDAAGRPMTDRDATRLRSYDMP